MELKNQIILIKGAGEKASAVASHLFNNSYRNILLTDIAFPTAERRGVSFSEAAHDNRKEVDGIVCEKTACSIEKIRSHWNMGIIPLLIEPEDSFLKRLKPDIMIDAILAKKNTRTSIKMAPLVIALGPGFCAGRDAHYVIETNPGSNALGNVIEKGFADSHTGIPTEVSGATVSRLLISPATGTLSVIKDIGDSVKEMEVIGNVGDTPLKATISGLIWGLIRTPANVKEGQKLGDISPVSDREICFRITPQALSIADGVMKAIYMAHPGNK